MIHEIQRNDMFYLQIRTNRIYEYVLWKRITQHRLVDLICVQYTLHAYLHITPATQYISAFNLCA